MSESMSQEEVRKLLRGDHVPMKKPRYAYDQIEITIPIPPLETRPNARGHWAKKANAVKKQRSDAMFAAVAELYRMNAKPPRWQQAEVQATFHRPEPQCRKADLDNLTGWLKASFDGLQDAGIIVNDGGFIHLPPKQLLGAEAGDESKVVLVITHRS